MFEFLSTVRSRQHRKAWFVAIMADAIQIIGFPLFFEGGISPFDIGLDIVTGAILTKILGWHWAFAPTFAAELVPGLDLFPTWTAAVFFVTRSQIRTVEPEILHPAAAPPQRSN
jgi:hypothetical protein